MKAVRSSCTTAGVGGCGGVGRDGGVENFYDRGGFNGWLGGSGEGIGNFDGFRLGGFGNGG